MGTTPANTITYRAHAEWRVFQEVLFAIACVICLQYLCSAASDRPINWNDRKDGEGYVDFGFDTPQEVRDPPRRIGAPINKRRTVNHKISISPQSRPDETKAPSDCGYLRHSLLAGMLLNLLIVSSIH
jgi:hypothetical protein